MTMIPFKSSTILALALVALQAITMPDVVGAAGIYTCSTVGEGYLVWVASDVDVNGFDESQPQKCGFTEQQTEQCGCGEGGCTKDGCGCSGTGDETITGLKAIVDAAYDGCNFNYDKCDCDNANDVTGVPAPTPPPSPPVYAGKLVAAEQLDAGAFAGLLADGVDFQSPHLEGVIMEAFKSKNVDAATAALDNVAIVVAIMIVNDLLEDTTHEAFWPQLRALLADLQNDKAQGSEVASSRINIPVSRIIEVASQGGVEAAKEEALQEVDSTTEEAPQELDSTIEEAPQEVDATTEEASQVVEAAEKASQVVEAAEDEREAKAKQASPSSVNGGNAKKANKKKGGNGAKEANSKKTKKAKGSTAPLASNLRSGAAPASSMVAVAALAAGLAVVAIVKSTTRKTTGHLESQPMLGIVAKGKLPSSTLA